MRRTRTSRPTSPCGRELKVFLAISRSRVIESAGSIARTANATRSPVHSANGGRDWQPNELKIQLCNLICGDYRDYRRDYRDDRRDYRDYQKAARKAYRQDQKNYRRWARGQYIPRDYMASRYYVDDYRDYQLA